MIRTPHPTRQLIALLALSVTIATGTLVGCNTAPPHDTGSNNTDTAQNTTQNTNTTSDASSQNTDGWTNDADSEMTMFAADTYVDYYRVVGGAKNVPSTVDDRGIVYGDLDELGRPTRVSGWITPKMRDAARERGRSKEDLPDPCGWPAKNPMVTIRSVDGRNDYHGYFWNRSHLIADSLGGAVDTRNLICGTRTQNVGDNSTPGGMAFTEYQSRSWLDNHSGDTDAALWYAATPLYEGDELIPRAVAVDVYTTDESINTRVIVFNAANGFDIDYNTGVITPADIVY